MRARGRERAKQGWARGAGSSASERKRRARSGAVCEGKTLTAGPKWRSGLRAEGGRRVGLAGFLSFSLVFLSFSFLLKQTNSNKTKLFEFKFKFESNPNTQTIKTMHRHECINKVNPMINF